MTLLQLLSLGANVWFTPGGPPGTPLMLISGSFNVVSGGWRTLFLSAVLFLWKEGEEEEEEEEGGDEEAGKV